MEGVTSGPIGGGTPYTGGTDAAEEAKNDNGKGVEGLSGARPQTPPPDTEGDQKTIQQMSEMEISEHKDVKSQVASSGDDSERPESIAAGDTPPKTGDTEETVKTDTETAEQGAEELEASADTGAPKETATTDKEEAATGDKPAEGGEGESQSGEGEQQTA